MNWVYCIDCSALFKLSTSGDICDKCYHGTLKSIASVKNIPFVSPNLPATTYQDYYEPTEDQIELDRLRKLIIEYSQEVPPEFEATFRKRFKDILA
jgi:hypothetical protein